MQDFLSMVMQERESDKMGSRRVSKATVYRHFAEEALTALIQRMAGQQSCFNSDFPALQEEPAVFLKRLPREYWTMTQTRKGNRCLE